MGLFQNLLETYEKCSTAEGVVQKDARNALIPVFHTVFESAICIVIDNEGTYISAYKEKRHIIIPCTDESLGRTSKSYAPHALCEQYSYLNGANTQKKENYLAQLFEWKGENRVLNAVYTYVEKGTIVGDLIGVSPNDKEIVRFIVYTNGEYIECWNSVELWNLWKDHELNKTNNQSCFDYLYGKDNPIIPKQYPKGIGRLYNAKFISSNDSEWFTFRGRFDKRDEAIVVDYENSQKMHLAARWIISNCSYWNDNKQSVVAWAVDDNIDVEIKPSEISYNLFEGMEKVNTTSEIVEESKRMVYTEYAQLLRKVLDGYSNANKLEQHARRICIAIFDTTSDSTGRLSVTFYQELDQNEYLQSIMKWHKDTSYYLTTSRYERLENGKTKTIPIHYIGAPSYDDILFAVYGKGRGDKSYDVLKKKVRKQLLECMFGNFLFPKSMVEMAANRSSRPMSFIDSNGKFIEKDWIRSINITCALIRKYYTQYKGGIELDLDTKRQDRDYLFGRLLSVADKLERTALYKADKQGTRATNATRLMSAFQVKPYSTWGQLWSQLIPYKNQLNGAGYYQLLIDEIMSLFQSGDYENNEPLSPLYLLGYSAQNRALAKSGKNESVEVDNNGDTAEQD